MRKGSDRAVERYRIRPGVVLTSVCGESFLVAAKAVQKYCPFFSQLNESSAFLWRKLSDSMSAEELKIGRAHV